MMGRKRVRTGVAFIALMGLLAVPDFVPVPRVDAQVDTGAPAVVGAAELPVGDAAPAPVGEAGRDALASSEASTVASVVVPKPEAGSVVAAGWAAERVPVAAADGFVRGAGVRLGSLPVMVAVRVGKAGASKGVPAVGVSFAAYDPGELARLGAEGLALSVVPEQVVGQSFELEFTIDYSAFAGLFGADWAQRVQVARWDCGPLDLAKDAVCGQPEVLQFSNDLQRQVLTAVLPVAAAVVDSTVVDPALDGPVTSDAVTVDSAPSEPVVSDPVSTVPVSTDPVVTETTAAAGSFRGVSSRSGVGHPSLAPAVGGGSSSVGLMSSTGSFAATSLSATRKWNVSTNEGSFNWSFPFEVPPGFAGLSPTVSLNYSSGGLDRMTSATNSQASDAGIGWSLDAGNGFIERRYLGCQDNRVGGGTDDSCWWVQNATLSFGGHSGELVPVNGTSGTANSFTVFRLANDPDWVVTRVPGAGADWWSGEYWTVTTPEGVTYTFGRSDDGQNSVLNTAIRGLSAGMPCYSKPDRFCSSMPYRWMLDKVTDQFGNTMKFVYDKETNKYGAMGDGYTFTTSYDRDAALVDIFYGATVAGGASSGVAAIGYRRKVHFDYTDRCIERQNTVNVDVACGTTDASYPDVPRDLICTTAPCFKSAPSYFSTRRLYSVTTLLDYGTSTPNWQRVNRWFLNHDFPSPGDGSSPKLWLRTVQKVTYNGTAWVGQMEEVYFAPTMLDNRRDANPAGGVPVMNIARLGSFSDEYGRRTDISYGHSACGSSPYPDWSTNTTDCFPMYACFQGGGCGPGVYKKWKVDDVVETDVVTGLPAAGSDNTAHAKDEEWHYIYSGGAAWHHDGDWWSDQPSVGDTTWSEFRGYGNVTTVHGPLASTTAEVTQVKYYRGHGWRPAGHRHQVRGSHPGMGRPCGHVLVRAVHLHRRRLARRERVRVVATHRRPRLPRCQPEPQLPRRRQIGHRCGPVVRVRDPGPDDPQGPSLGPYEKIYDFTGSGAATPTVAWQYRRTNSVWTNSSYWVAGRLIDQSSSGDESAPETKLAPRPTTTPRPNVVVTSTKTKWMNLPHGPKLRRRRRSDWLYRHHRARLDTVVLGVAPHQSPRSSTHQPGQPTRSTVTATATLVGGTATAAASYGSARPPTTQAAAWSPPTDPNAPSPPPATNPVGADPRPPPHRSLRSSPPRTSPPKPGNPPPPPTPTATSAATATTTNGASTPSTSRQHQHLRLGARDRQLCVRLLPGRLPPQRHRPLRRRAWVVDATPRSICPRQTDRVRGVLRRLRPPRETQTKKREQRGHGPEPRHRDDLRRGWPHQVHHQSKADSATGHCNLTDRRVEPSDGYGRKGLRPGRRCRGC